MIGPATMNGPEPGMTRTPAPESQRTTELSVGPAARFADAPQDLGVSALAKSMTVSGDAMRTEMSSKGNPPDRNSSTVRSAELMVAQIPETTLITGIDSILQSKTRRL
jgi:hypothetical protein